MDIVINPGELSIQKITEQLSGLEVGILKTLYELTRASWYKIRETSTPELAFVCAASFEDVDSAMHEILFSHSVTYRNGKAEWHGHLVNGDVIVFTTSCGATLRHYSFSCPIRLHNEEFDSALERMLEEMCEDKRYK
jgi:hypothetical protein